MEDYLINLANRMNYDFYIGVVGLCVQLWKYDILKIQNANH